MPTRLSAAPSRSPSAAPARRVAFAFFPALFCLLLLASGCSLHGTAPLPTAYPQSGKGAVAGTSISKTALTTVGTKYKYGGTTPAQGFDCSGLVCWSYAKSGISLPRTARAQSGVGTGVAKNALRPGDIVAFKISGGMHTGIYTGKGKFVHSPRTGKTVREDSINSTYWRKRFVTGRRHERLR